MNSDIKIPQHHSFTPKTEIGEDVPCAQGYMDFLRNKFSPELLAEYIEQLPPQNRQRIIDRFLLERPTRRIERVFIRPRKP
jgi:hypothetical protein